MHAAPLIRVQRPPSRPSQVLMFPLVCWQQATLAGTLHMSRKPGAASLEAWFRASCVGVGAAGQTCLSAKSGTALNSLRPARKLNGISLDKSEIPVQMTQVVLRDGRFVLDDKPRRSRPRAVS